jgi:hypothetical protein
MIQTLEQRLMSAFKSREMVTRPGWFVVWDERANIDLSVMFGITTDAPVYEIENKFKVMFDWNLQKWCITA